MLEISQRDGYVYVLGDISNEKNFWEQFQAILEEVWIKHPGVMPDRGLVGPNIQSLMNRDYLTCRMEAKPERMDNPKEGKQKALANGLPVVPIVMIPGFPPNTVALRFAKGN